MTTNRSSSAANRRASAASESAAKIRASSRSTKRPHGSDEMYGVVVSSTSRAWARVSPVARVREATCRACQTRTRPAVSSAHNFGSRCRTSSASAINVAAATWDRPSSTPSSAAANSPANGVPSPPYLFDRSVPGSTVPDEVGCRSAHWAASTNSRHSDSTKVAWLDTRASATACRSRSSATGFIPVNLGVSTDSFVSGIPCAERDYSEMLVRQSERSERSRAQCRWARRLTGPGCGLVSTGSTTGTVRSWSRRARPPKSGLVSTGSTTGGEVPIDEAGFRWWWPGLDGLDHRAVAWSRRARPPVAGSTTGLAWSRRARPPGVRFGWWWPGLDGLDHRRHHRVAAKG